MVARDDDPAARADLRGHRTRCPSPHQIVPATAARRRPQKIAGWTRSPKPTAARGQGRAARKLLPPVILKMSHHAIPPDPAASAETVPSTPLRRLEADFLRPYRWAIGLGLLGLLVQSVLLLPMPLLQGWVLDKLVALAGAAGNGAAAGLATAAQLADRSGVAWAIGLALCGTIGLHLARSAHVVVDRGHDGADQPGGRGGDARGTAPQADAAAHGLLRRPADRPAHGPGHQRRRQHPDVHPQRDPPAPQRPDPVAWPLPSSWSGSSGGWRSWPWWPCRSMRSTSGSSSAGCAGSPTRSAPRSPALYALLERAGLGRAGGPVVRQGGGRACRAGRADRPPPRPDLGTTPAPPRRWGRWRR